MRSFTPFQDLQSLAVGISPKHGPPPMIRDALEAQRLSWRHTPDAQYPSGYLGTITDRREDRIRGAVWRNQRSYTRGVHKGERINMESYLWPDEFNLETGVMNQAVTGQRFVSPAYNPDPVVLTNFGKAGPRDARVPTVGTPAPATDPDRIRYLKSISPQWSW